MQLKAVILDYGGVLCFHPRDEQIDALAQASGLDRDAFLKAYWSKRASYDRGDLTAPEYWAHIGSAAGRSYTSQQVDEFRKRDVDFWVTLDSRMVEWAQRLRASGLRMGLLSNLPFDLGENMRAHMNLLAGFDHHSFSYELRSAKPDAAIYHDAVRGVGVEPGEALFIDDKLENVEGAMAIGLHAIQFESPDQLAARLSLNGFGSLILP